MVLCLINQNDTAECEVILSGLEAAVREGKMDDGTVSRSNLYNPFCDKGEDGPRPKSMFRTTSEGGEVGG